MQSATRTGTQKWSCFFCQHARPRTSNLATGFRRTISNSTTKRAEQPPRQGSRQDVAPSMAQMREHYNKKNKTVGSVNAIRGRERRTGTRWTDVLLGTTV